MGFSDMTWYSAVQSSRVVAVLRVQYVFLKQRNSRSHDGSFVRTTYSGKGWACNTTGVDQDNFVHGRWTRMVDDPHVGE